MKLFCTLVLLLLPPIAYADLFDLNGNAYQAEDVLIVVLAGQSNMTGGDGASALATRPVDRSIHPRVFQVTQSSVADDRDTPYVAREPLHIQALQNQGMRTGPGMYFARLLADANPDKMVLLAPCGWSGSKLSTWDPPFGTNWTRCRQVVERALPYGTLTVVLWSQGEADAGAEALASTYGTRLYSTVDEMRAYWSAPDLPFIAAPMGTLGPGLTSTLPYWQDVDAATLAIGANVTNAASITYTSPEREDIHFTPAEQEARAGAFYQAYLDLL